MENQLATIDTEILSSLILNGNIAKLNQVQRVQYVTKLCERLGLDPLTQPFKILSLQGKEVLYADKGCTQQLCKIYGISTEVTKRERIEDVYVVTVRASDKEGRFTDDDGVVTVGSSKGDILANALMKAVTKAKRRAVLAFCGLGMLDESEIETIPNAHIIETPAPAPGITNGNGHAKASQPAHDPNNDKITSEQGSALLTILAGKGWTREDLKKMIGEKWGLNGLGEINNGHLPKIKEHFSKPKAQAVQDEVMATLEANDASFN